MIFLFIIKPRVKKVRNKIHDIPVQNKPRVKKLEIQFMIFRFIIKPRVKK